VYVVGFPEETDVVGKNMLDDGECLGDVLLDQVCVC